MFLSRGELTFCRSFRSRQNVHLDVFHARADRRAQSVPSRRLSVMCSLYNCIARSIYMDITYQDKGPQPPEPCNVAETDRCFPASTASSVDLSSNNPLGRDPTPPTPPSPAPVPYVPLGIAASTARELKTVCQRGCRFADDRIDMNRSTKLTDVRSPAAISRQIAKQKSKAKV